MTAILVSPTEPPLIRSLGSTSGVPEQYGCDILLGARWGLVGIQRKQFPDDFVASLHGDRFAKLLPKMDGLALALVILEGQPLWTIDGVLLHDRHRLRRSSVDGLLLSLLHVYEVGSFWTESEADTAVFVETVANWSAKERHDSLAARGAAKGDAWGRKLEGSWQLFVLQGIEGIGPELARRIVDHFGRVPLRWDATEEELLEVEGIGKGKLAKMTKVIPARGDE